MSDSSILKVFSIIKNIENVINNQTFESYDSELIRSYVHHKWLENAPEFYKIHCTRIYNEIENNWYTYDDLILSILYKASLNYSQFLDVINEKFVTYVRFLFTKNVVNKDKYFLIELNKKLKLKNFNSFFETNSNGITYIYFLIQKRYISPMFWIQYDYIFTTKKQSYAESLQHKNFRKLMKVIEQEIVS